MAAQRYIAGVFREVWRETIAQDGGTGQLLATDIPCTDAVISRLQPFLQLDDITGTPDFRNSTFSVVGGKLQINIVNSAAPGNSATWVLDVTLNHSVQQARGVLSPVLIAFFAGFPSAVWVPAARLVATGNGLQGGGDLSADRTLSVLPDPDGSIVASPLGTKVGVLALDAQHGARGGGTQHALAVPLGDAGFISGASQAKLDGLPSSAVPTTRTITAGDGLVGGGDLSADRTFTVQSADSSIVVGPSGVRVNYPYVEKTAAYLITLADYTINCTANSFPVTLPTAVGIVGRMFVVKNSGSGVITLDTTAGQLIDGVLTATLNTDDSITVQSTNAGWIII